MVGICELCQKPHTHVRVYDNGTAAVVVSFSASDIREKSFFHWLEAISLKWNFHKKNFFSFDNLNHNFLFVSSKVTVTAWHIQDMNGSDMKAFYFVWVCFFFSFLFLCCFLSLLVWNSRRLAGSLFDLTIFASFDSRICFGICSQLFIVIITGWGGCTKICCTDLVRFRSVEKKYRSTHCCVFCAIVESLLPDLSTRHSICVSKHVQSFARLFVFNFTVRASTRHSQCVSNYNKSIHVQSQPKCVALELEHNNKADAARKKQSNKIWWHLF